MVDFHRDRQMKTAIVIPCLNEKKSIVATARSLGFGLGVERAPPDCTLILVDNMSIDGTPVVLERIRDRSAPGSVIVLSEAERGYVPPRHRGALAAQEIAENDGIPLEEMLVLQADGDTIYEPGYIDAMRDTATAAGPNTLIEGSTHPPHRFLVGHPGYQRLANGVDAAVEPLCVPDELDVIVDDKVAGFTVATYRAWGGHRREYNSKGVELHAETTRLFIRGVVQGGMRARATGAFAQPSRRKILRNPVRHFATAGFPRGEAWWRSWNAQYAGPYDLAAFEDPAALSSLAPAMAARRAHMLVLFAALPVMIHRTLTPTMVSRELHPVIEAFVQEIEPVADYVSAGDLGPVFEVVLAKLDVWAARLGAFTRSC